MHSLGALLGKWIWEIEDMPASRLVEYMAMYQIAPWGEDRADLRAGYIAATQYNVNRQRGQRALKVSDFLPDFAPKKRQTAAEMEALFGMYAAGHNARIEAKK
jgi:hypothetical protein